ncbi:MAG TPA: hypothetical protein VK210_10865, partial [Terriglobia bacterium]|nr:hypothetical protein [Terriglobia bacterium]
NRYPNGIYSVTTINPDLVGEIRIILAPVDVEIGRGNGTIQITTRSGTNKYTGSAVWTARNTALNANTWSNNRNQTIPVGSTATVPVALKPDWNNIHQFTASYGGPIVKNKTFFFALFDANSNVSRSLSNFVVPTACARLGIFRYFNGWNNGNIFTAKNETSATSAAYPSVLPNGTPVNPMNNGTIAPGGLPPGWVSGPYDASLQAISVFGPLSSKPQASDCSDAPINTTTLVPNGVSVTANPGSGGGWDLYRKQLDTTGFISRMMAYYPLPNNFETGDGLNTAGYRLLRHYRGLDNLFGSGEGTGVRRQINVKIDQNFSANQKLNFNITYERVSSDDTVAGIPAGTAPGIPGMFSNSNFRHPMVLSSGFTSTLSSTLLNEARFGMRREGTNVVAPWDIAANQADLNKLLPPQVNTPTGDIRVIPQFTNFGFCEPYSGSRPPGSACIGFTATSQDNTPTYTFADTLSWTLGAHALKFGAELRLNSSDRFGTSPGTFFGTPALARPINGSITGTTQGTSATTDIANTNPAMQFLLSLPNNQGNAPNARGLAAYLAASLSNVTQAYFLTSASQVDFANITDPAKNHWSDYRDVQLPHTKFIQREFDVFVKDDYKISKNLTLNLGVRWDYFGVPYLGGGVSTGLVGGGAAAFGISGRDFTGWMNPGQRADVSNFEFVGPGSQNPGRGLFQNDLNNFSPGVGFAWQVPYFGEGKTTVRGGYQVTYQGGGRFNALQDAIGLTPGSTLAGSPNWSNVYQDLSTVAPSIPVTPSVLPMQPLPLNTRNQNFTAFDPHYVSPYVQNFTMSITRNVSRAVTLDLLYVGTLSRKTYGTLNLNSNNFLYNGLLDELSRVRLGTEITKTVADPKSLLDQMFNGINMCAGATACTALPAGQSFGAIGTTTGSGANAVFQTAALQMRSNTTFQTNLANANFNAIAGSVSNFNYVVGATAANNSLLPAIPAGTVGGALRLNGFPENEISTNPQFGTLNYMTNYGYSNYHSLQVQTTVRPIQGVSIQGTYTWSKNLGLGTITDPTNRKADYTYVNSNPTQTIRTNSTFELPLGPNKLLMGNTSGWLARAVEHWQLAMIYNYSVGTRTSIGATSMLYANGVPDIVYPVNFNDLKGERAWNVKNGVNLESRYFDSNDLFVKVPDPQCNTVTSAQNLNLVVNGVQTRCTLNALAMAVPAGTANSFSTVFADGVTRNAVIVLQQAQPGKKGNLGNNTVSGIGNFSLDANMGKTFRITESKSLQ